MKQCSVLQDIILPLMIASTWNQNRYRSRYTRAVHIGSVFKNIAESAGRFSEWLIQQ